MPRSRRPAPPETSPPARAVPAFAPFEDDDAVRTVGALAFENGRTRIAVHGSLDLTRDRAGLAHARLLRQTVEAIVTALEADALPETAAEAPDRAPRIVRNPLA